MCFFSYDVDIIHLSVVEVVHFFISYLHTTKDLHVFIFCVYLLNSWHTDITVQRSTYAAFSRKRTCTL